MSKGSHRRPLFVPESQLEINWQRTFGRKEPPKKLIEKINSLPADEATKAAMREMAGEAPLTSPHTETRPL